MGGAGPRSCAGLEVGVGITALQYFTMQQVSLAQRGEFSPWPACLRGCLLCLLVQTTQGGAACWDGHGSAGRTVLPSLVSHLNTGGGPRKEEKS